MFPSKNYRSIVRFARCLPVLTLAVAGSSVHASDCDQAATALIAIQCLEAKIAKMQSDLTRLQAEMSSIPKDSVVAFDATDCPTGWGLYKPAQGRFIRGIDQSGKDIDPDGERSPGTLQKDQFAKHSHALPGVVYDAGGGPNASWVAAAKNLGYGHVNTPPTAPAGEGNETRPVNVALLYCIKK